MNSFKQQLEQYAQWTQECLEQLLPPQEGDRVTEAMRYPACWQAENGCGQRWLWNFAGCCAAMPKER